MAGMSNYLKVELIKHVFRTGTFDDVAHLYISLHTGDPTGAGLNEVSVTDTGYARVYCPSYDTSWSAPSDTNGRTENLIDIVFPTPTGSTNWGLITHFGIWDASTGGNFLLYAPLTPPKPVSQGQDAPKMSAGVLIVTFT